MSRDQKPASNKSMWAVLALLLLPVVCCTAPVLVSVGAASVFGLIGAAANNVWVSAAAALIAVSAVGLLLHRWKVRKETPSRVDDCCQSAAASPDNRMSEDPDGDR